MKKGKLIVSLLAVGLVLTGCGAGGADVVSSDGQQYEHSCYMTADNEYNGQKVATKYTIYFVGDLTGKVNGVTKEGYEYRNELSYDFLNETDAKAFYDEEKEYLDDHSGLTDLGMGTEISINGKNVSLIARKQENFSGQTIKEVMNDLSNNGYTCK